MPTAFVTGAASGMGRATALALAREGFAVALADRRADDLGEVVAEIDHGGGRALAIPIDVADGDAVEAAFARCDAELGPVWALAAAAGITEGGFALERSIEHFERQLDVNFLGVVRTNVAAARRMVAAGDGGRIVNWSSFGALGGTAGYSAYCAAKAAVSSFTQSLALELGEHGITVNAVLPGSVRTPMLGFVSADAVRAEAERTPLRRIGEPDDVANAVRFFVGEQGAWVTGTTLSVDGGLAAAMGRGGGDAVRAHIEREAEYLRAGVRRLPGEPATSTDASAAKAGSR